jgi:sporulation protein YqfC
MQGKERLVEALDITKDAALNVPLVTIVGNMQVYVENFKSIAAYDCTTAKLLTKNGFVTVVGERLEIMYYDEEEIAIRGRICRIEL